MSATVAGAARGAVSVCMATYNGERFLEEQLASIVAQLQPGDEVVVVDDASTDGTVGLVESFGDSRIAVYRNEKNLGVNQSFARAIALSAHGTVFMADQDDIWVEGRVEAMCRALQEGSLVVASNSLYVDGAGTPIPFPAQPLQEGDSARHLKNIARIFAGSASYFGCAMAFRRELVDLILPLPRYVESHDLWIALAGNLAGANRHLEGITLKRRVHGNNASIIRRPLHRKLWSRGIFLLSLWELSSRYGAWKLRRKNGGDRGK